ncbi:phenylalanine--tRNA ligase subunit beta [Halobacteriovorax vibrionivorans]|uniref:Phenylalanine--tRNA ligase beta subunit n=1 Tax=Halobacteriovorax vibrionivorans TaxID=2152716 RepID=A0ABY0IE11_9BACT|nr:phenylalanine--tRNA ligase subunit beta [Halobacteriovorax vibrionivorans]RZF21188.1 phenylalanine--tRNA ligase subunit beta [Halobacteriovorax vibrionivorans]
MLISIDWIKDFVKVPDLDANEIGSKFTLATAEVEDVLSVGDHLEAITVVEVLEKEKHPEADKLNLVTFTNGKDKFQVVCGAANVRVGMRTAYAPLGITLPNGLTLEPKKIRGVLSEGMLCSEEELGFAEDSAGIIELDKVFDNPELGKNMLELYNEKKDVLLDVDNKSLTHRPDLWGHFGIAREFATIFENELQNPFNESWSKDLKSKFSSDSAPMKIKVEEGTSCLGYFGLSVDNVKVGESPLWMKKRLQAVGLRPINNIVDISNYVMLELGIPLHIFDREKISGDTVVITSLKDETEFTTLDEEKRKLVAGDTVIGDSDKPLVLAGIMGGLNSGVDENTSKIFIEVANWKAAEVRKTSTRLGLRTDSSSRYEKTLDSLMLERTLLRTLEYILKENPEAKVIGDIQYDGPNLSEIKPVSIESSATKINKALGKEVSFDEMKRIFTSLDIQIEGSADKFIAHIPSYRATKDIETGSCLVEEIGRVIGFDNIAPTSPKLDISPVKLSPAQKLHRSMKNFMVNHASAFEVMTYPMIGPKLLKKAMYDHKGGLELINALSKDAALMRESLVPSFLEAAAANAKNSSAFKFFEIGRTYHANDKDFVKEESVYGALYFDKESTPFMDLLNDTTRLLDSVNINYQLNDRNPKFKSNAVDEDWNGIHPYEFYNLRIQGKMDGVIFSVHPLVLKQFKIKGNVSIALVNMSAFESRPQKDKVKYQPLAKFPGSTFDCTVEVSEEVAVGDILKSLSKLKIKELTSTTIADIYKHDNMKSVTLRSEFLDPNSTLSGEFITEASNKIVETLEKNGFPLKK